VYDLFGDGRHGALFPINIKPLGIAGSFRSQCRSGADGIGLGVIVPVFKWGLQGVNADGMAGEASLKRVAGAANLDGISVD